MQEKQPNHVGLQDRPPVILTNERLKRRDSFSKLSTAVIEIEERLQEGGIYAKPAAVRYVWIGGPAHYTYLFTVRHVEGGGGVVYRDPDLEQSGPAADKEIESLRDQVLMLQGFLAVDSVTIDRLLAEQAELEAEVKDLTAILAAYGIGRRDGKATL